MKIQVRKDVIYVYNKDDEVLAILGADENSTMYRISGWFGRKLYELLESKSTFDELPPESQEFFSRLLATLVEENILAPLEDNERNDFKLLTQKEWKYFNTKNFSGSLVASAHSFGYDTCAGNWPSENGHCHQPSSCVIVPNSCTFTIDPFAGTTITTDSVHMTLVDGTCPTILCT